MVTTEASPGRLPRRFGVRPSAQRGFSLVELMIALAIAAILVSIAYPAYQSYVLKSRRADAKGALLDLAQFMERNYTEANRYDKDSAGADVALPYSEAPQDGTAKYYDLSLSSVSQNAFTLSAVPKGTQAADTECASFTLTHTGARSATGTGAAGCW